MRWKSVTRPRSLQLCHCVASTLQGGLASQVAGSYIIRYYIVIFRLMSRWYLSLASLCQVGIYMVILSTVYCGRHAHRLALVHFVPGPLGRARCYQLTLRCCSSARVGSTLCLNVLYESVDCPRSLSALSFASTLQMAYCVIYCR